MSTINIYDLNYTDAFKLGIRNYANFNGRASRSEYWRFVAGVTLIQGLLGILALLCSNLGFPNYEALIDNVTVGVSLFFIVPNIAITTRRMHDIGRSGWTQLISFIPVIGLYSSFTNCVVAMKERIPMVKEPAIHLLLLRLARLQD